MVDEVRGPNWWRRMEMLKAIADVSRRSCSRVEGLGVLPLCLNGTKAVQPRQEAARDTSEYLSFAELLTHSLAVAGCVSHQRWLGCALTLAETALVTFIHFGSSRGIYPAATALLLQLVTQNQYV